MKSSGELLRILSTPPPRALKHILKGPAFVKSAAYLAAAAATIVVGLVVLWNYLFAHYREPLFGNERLVVSYLLFVYSIAGFIVFWSLSFMNIYSLYLFRKGKLKSARIEKSYIQEKGGRKLFIINWVIEEDGRITKGAISSPVADMASFRQDVEKGDVIHLLSSGRDLGDAMPVGMMNLRREWTLLPSLAVPGRYAALRSGTILWVAASCSVAVVGFLSSHLLDPNVPSRFVMAGAAAGIVTAGLFRLLGRRVAHLFRPNWALWAAAVFVATYFMVFGGIRGLNVWLDREETRTCKAEVLELDDALFPALHRFAYVRSWRPGRIKEKVPLSWRTGLMLSPGDSVILEVQEGYFGMPAVTAVKR
jgi:hypothetical protein